MLCQRTPSRRPVAVSANSPVRTTLRSIPCGPIRSGANSSETMPNSVTKVAVATGTT